MPVAPVETPFSHLVVVVRRALLEEINELIDSHMFPRSWTAFLPPLHPDDDDAGDHPYIWLRDPIGVDRLLALQVPGP